MEAGGETKRKRPRKGGGATHCSCGEDAPRWPRGLGALERQTGKEIGSPGKSREWERSWREKAWGGGVQR